MFYKVFFNKRFGRKNAFFRGVNKDFLSQEKVKSAV